jgi:hypothetical protein
MGMVLVAIFILVLVLLIPAAYFVGRFVQWSRDANHVMGPWDRRR